MKVNLLVIPESVGDPERPVASPVKGPTKELALIVEELAVIFAALIVTV